MAAIPSGKTSAAQKTPCGNNDSSVEGETLSHETRQNPAHAGRHSPRGRNEALSCKEMRHDRKNISGHRKNGKHCVQMQNNDLDTMANMAGHKEDTPVTTIPARIGFFQESGSLDLGGIPV